MRPLFGTILGTGPLAPGQRFLANALAWTAIVLGGPGFLGRDGSSVLAVLGFALWGATALRPFDGSRRWGRFAEFATNGLGAGMWMAWVGFVFFLANVYVILGFGVWLGATALAARRLARRFSAGVAVALALLGLETARAVLPPPLGIEWLRLGHHLHHHLWLSGSARVWGIEGLSFVVAGAAGLGAALLFRRRPRASELGIGLVPLALAVAFAAATRPPERLDGPRVLLVQPGFPQERKMAGDWKENFREQRELTMKAANALAEAGTPPDLVAWAESMLVVQLYRADLRRALAGDIRQPDWEEPLTVADLDEMDEWERDWVGAGLFGIGTRTAPGEALPPDTALIAGAELFVPRGNTGADAELRRQVCVALYQPERDAAGARSLARSLGMKRHLVPGAESLLGLERFGPLRSLFQSLAGYVPDFVPSDGPSVFELTGRDGTTWRFSGGICFDNAFLDTFVDAFDPDGDAMGDAAKGAPLDFHFIASNEAWYRTSFEMDQMVAFSRIAALATGRALARATNSGVSLVLDADGRELGRVERDGADRAVAGTLALVVPVPRESERAARTPYVRTRRLWTLAALLGPLAALLAPRRTRGAGETEGYRGAGTE